MRLILKRLRFLSNLTLAFLAKHQRLLVFSFLIGIISFAVLPRLTKILPARRKVHKMGLVGKFSISQLPPDVQGLISLGLTSVNENGTVASSLASSWQVSEDGKSYTFTLKENQFWHDGSPVLAQDIVYNFSDVATSYSNDKTVEFRLKEPFSPFPSVVSRPVFKKGLIGAGEYQVVSLKLNGQIVEEIFLKPVNKKSTKEELKVRFYPTEETARIAFKLGEIETINGLSGLGDLSQWGNLEVTPEVKLNRFVAIFFDTQSEKFSDKSLRQALAYALEKQWTPRALSPINPSSWFYNPSVKQYRFDLDNSKKLLQSVFESEEALEKIEVELATVPSLLPIAETIKEDWEKISLKTNIKVVNIIPEDFEVLLATQEVPSDPDQYTLWHSTQPRTNISHYKSPKIDKLLEDGRKILDREERKEVYLDFQRFIVEETPAIFLFHPTLYTVSRK